MAQITAKRIVKGYPFRHRLIVTSPSGGPPAMPDLTAASRVRGSVRAAASPGLAPIAALDTADGSLVVAGAYDLLLVIPAAVTALFPLSGVALVFERLDGTAWSPLPFTLPSWPVRAGSPS